MGFWPNRSRQPGTGGWRNRRAERYTTPTVKCQLGSVVDMSATGMRLTCDKKPPVVVGQVYTTRISFDDGAMPLKVQVRWLKRRGLKTYELGLAFVGLKPGADLVLDAVAKFGMASAARKAGDAHTGNRSGKRHASSSRSHAGPRVDSDLPDYYGELGLDSSATDAQIKTAYRKLAVVCHPDRCDAPDAMERFERLHEAYQVLADPKRRKSYAQLRD